MEPRGSESVLCRRNVNVIHKLNIAPKLVWVLQLNTAGVGQV